MNQLKISLPQSVDEAPKYSETEYTGVKLVEAVIVPRGMVSGSPSIDLVFQDQKGKKYVAMTTCGLIEGLHGAVVGVKKRNAN